jgi:hypothetical protein
MTPDKNISVTEKMPEPQKSVMPVEAAHLLPANPGISKGERLYNWTVYSGLNYWTVLITSLAMGDYLKNLSGRKHLLWATGKIAKGLESAGMNLNKAHHNTKIALETLSLTAGGWLLLIPLRMLENRKRPVVHWLNKKFGVDQTALDGHELTPDEIYLEQEQPTQSWARVIGRRLLASVVVVSSGNIADHVGRDTSISRTHEYAINPYDPKSEIVTHTGHPGGLERLTNVVVKGLEHLSEGSNIMKGRTKRWVELLTLDTLFTRISATVMHLTNGARKMERERAKHKAEEAQAVTFAENTPPPMDENAPLTFSEKLSSSRIVAQKGSLPSFREQVVAQQQDAALAPGVSA